MPRSRPLNRLASRWRTGGLNRRLVAASLMVALVSIALLAAVTLSIADTDVGRVGREQEASTTRELVASLQATYTPGAGWRPSTLAAIGDLARATGFGLTVTTSGRKLLAVVASGARGPSRTIPLVVSGRRIASAILRYPSSGLSVPEAKLRARIGAAVLVASLLAALVALATAVLTSRRLVAPIRLLTGTARRLGAGDLASRVGEVRAPSEIVELARSFDTMASHLERESILRRAIVADLAHELRTPLAILQAELEALRLGMEELNQASVASLQQEVGRMTRLVEDLQVLAAAEAARLSLQLEQVDLGAVAAAAAARLEKRFAERRLTLTVEAEPTKVLADRGRIEQLVANLLSNAAKFTAPGGSVQLRVGQDEGQAHLTVADTGVGIPLAEQGFVFDRFFRGAAARGVSGSGVGLAVVAELAAVHGGSVQLDSEPGAGTRVTVRLPLARG